MQIYSIDIIAIMLGTDNAWTRRVIECRLGAKPRRDVGRLHKDVLTTSEGMLESYENGRHRIGMYRKLKGNIYPTVY